MRGRIASPPPRVPSYAASEPPWYVLVAVLAAALLLQTALGPFLSLRGATPPLVLLVVWWYALQSGSGRGLVVGLIAGACEDALAANAAPSWTFATAAVGALAGRLRGTHFAESRFWLCAGAGIAALLRYGLYAFFEQVAGRAPLLPAEHLHAALWQSVYATALAALAVAFIPAVRDMHESRI